MIKRNLILLLLTLTLGVVIFNSPLKRNAEGSIFSTVNKGVVLNELLEIDNFSKSDNITILNLWASWCIPCQNEVGELKKISLNDKYQVIGILVDDSVENGKEFIKKNNIDYINVLDEFSAEQLLIKFIWNGIPTTLILNENLEIIYTINGEITAKEIFNLTD
jgi:thiol-disulfide isomerase/thioredoxin